jgi:hypothetical protein
MFEDFSFPSPSSDRRRCLAAEGDIADCDSTMISPLSSRSPSPSSISHRLRPLTQSRSIYSRRHQPPTSIPPSYERYHRRISVGALTEKLHAHTLEGDTRRDDQIRSPLSPVSPRLSAWPSQSLLIRTEDHEDEGYDEPMYQSPLQSHPTSSYIHPASVPSIRHSVSSLSPPPEEDSLEYCDAQQQGNVRLHRQYLSRVQCSAPAGVDALRLAFLAEESQRQTVDSGTVGDNDCHPSSLPPELSPPRRTSVLGRRASRQFSGSGLGSSSRERSYSPPESSLRRRSSSAASFSSGSKVGKSRHHLQSLSARELFLRKKRSEQTLGRKSLVNAALASMMFETPIRRLS